MPSVAERGAGLFSRDSITWRVNSQAALLLGGGRALLMQLAHPAVAAGVDEHSDFRERPLRRLHRTLALTFQLSLGTRAQAEAAARRINARHRTVRGEDYEATDPDLLLWVHATLVDSALVTYSTFVGALSSAEGEVYLRESRTVGRMLGIPATRFPAGLPEFNAYVDRMVTEELRVDGRARKLAGFVLRPPVRGVPAAVAFPGVAITAGLLPAPLREAYRLPWGRAERAAFGAARAVLPALLARTPGALREVSASRG